MTTLGLILMIGVIAALTAAFLILRKKKVLKQKLLIIIYIACVVLTITICLLIFNNVSRTPIESTGDLDIGISSDEGLQSGLEDTQSGLVDRDEINDPSQYNPIFGDEEIDGVTGVAEPIIIEVPVIEYVEVPTVELIETDAQGNIIDRTQFVDRPLNTMDMSNEARRLINTLNDRFGTTFNGIRIGGGEYAYGFTSHTEFLINYYFILPNGERFTSFRFLPLCLNPDQFVIDQIVWALSERLGWQNPGTPPEPPDNNGNYYNGNGED